MKHISKIIIIGFISLAFLGGTQVHAQGSQAETSIMLQSQIKVLLLDFIKQLEAQLADLVQQQSTEGKYKESESVEVKQRTITYPKQTTKDVTISSSVISVSGVDNDYVEYETEFMLNAFGSDSYISERFNDTFNFSITNNLGVTVYDTLGAQSGSVVASFSSDADIDDSHYLIKEDDTEVFSLNITYSPHSGISAGSGAYRMQLDSIKYKTNREGPVVTYNTSGLGKFRSKSGIIVN